VDPACETESGEEDLLGTQRRTLLSFSLTSQTSLAVTRLHFRGIQEIAVRARQVKMTAAFGASTISRVFAPLSSEIATSSSATSEYTVWTLTLKPLTPNSTTKPQTPTPKLHNQPSNLTPYTLNPKLHTPYLTPYAPNPRPYTLHPKPKPLNPKP